MSPFPYQGPLRPAEVRGRDELLDRLVAQATARNVTALIGPRRYGKTSLLRRLAAELDELSTVWLDLYGTAATVDLALALDAALTDAGALSPHARSLAASMELNLGVVRASLGRPARRRPDPEVIFQTLLDVLVAAAQRTPTLLIIDEFSAISAVPEAAAKLRTALQPHYRDLAIVFAGSAPSVMRQLFTGRHEPFYGQADLIEIDRLRPAAVDAIVTEGFAATGRDPGVAAPRILELTGGHPQRSMQAADALWHHTEAGHAVTDEVWLRGLDYLRRAVADPLARIYDTHGEHEAGVLRVIANGGSPTGAMGRQYGLAKSTASRARKALLDRGDLLSVEGEIILTDPLMADWLRETLPMP